jgi:hypothetical protein
VPLVAGGRQRPTGYVPMRSANRCGTSVRSLVI